MLSEISDPSCIHRVLRGSTVHRVEVFWRCERKFWCSRSPSANIEQLRTSTDAEQGQVAGKGMVDHRGLQSVARGVIIALDLGFGGVQDRFHTVSSSYHHPLVHMIPVFITRPQLQGFLPLGRPLQGRP